MLKREADEKLQDSCRSSSHKCLVVRGPRQVGRTWSIRNLGRSGLFDSFIEVNFQEQPE